MTLVLSCLTPDYVIQVSDKRITRICDGAVIEVIDDLRNKGTMYCAQMAFGYTGLAEIEGIRSDRWLAKILAEAGNFEAGINSLVDRAGRAFQTIVCRPSLKRHAFVGVGYCRPSPDAELRACQITVSNSSSFDKATFRIEGPLLRENRLFHICPPVDAFIPDEIVHSLKKNIRACVSHRTKPTAIMWLMAETVRRVAKFENRVSRALLILFVPREAVERSRIYFLTPIAPSGLSGRFDFPMFLHVPSDTSTSDSYWDFPNFACNGMLSFGSFEQGGVPVEGPSPAPETRLDLESYRLFLLHSDQIQQWVEFVQSLGVAVTSLGTLSHHLEMLQQAGIQKIGQLETLLRNSEAWERGCSQSFFCRHRKTRPRANAFLSTAVRL